MCNIQPFQLSSYNRSSQQGATVPIGGHTYPSDADLNEPEPGFAGGGSLQSSVALPHSVAAAVSQMGHGWTMSLNVSVSHGASGAPSQPSRVGVALIHPDRGIALVDIAPASTRDAASRLRRDLAAARFPLIFAGYIPIVYRQLAQENIPRLGSVIDAAFADEPPISLHGGHAWTGLARRVLGGEHWLELRSPMQWGGTHGPPVPRSNSAGPRPASLPHGLRALGYFWLAVIAVLSLGAAFLQYTYLPSAQAGAAPNRPGLDRLR